MPPVAGLASGAVSITFANVGSGRRPFTGAFRFSPRTRCDPRLAKGAVKLGGNLELQTSPEGREVDVPLVIEYGVTDGLELLIEPVASSHILPKVGPRAHSVGDTEVTALYRLRPRR